MNFENYEEDEYYRKKEAEHLELVETFLTCCKWALIGIIIYALIKLF